MTIGIAVISREGDIIGAADRAITWADLKVEPRRSKILHFNNCPVSILWAGSLSTSSQVLAVLANGVGQQKPEDITLGAIAHTAADLVGRLFGTIAETRFLAPLGHSRASLLADANIEAGERKSLLDQVQGFEPSEREAAGFLFAGYDPDGMPRIYRVRNTEVEDCTMEGYAAIGSGDQLAEQIFHRYGYVRSHSHVWKALLLTYLAKVEAEDDVWVGTQSNIFMREPVSKAWQRMSARMVRILDRAYKQHKRDQGEAFLRAAKSIPAEFKQLLPARKKGAKQSRKGPRRG